MFIDYIILGIISAGTLIWAYRHVPGSDDDPFGNDGDGGLPIGGDSYPSSDPPSFAVNHDDERESEPSSSSGSGIPA
jgi:hypothetical protein